MPREGRFLEILVEHLERFLAGEGIKVTSPEIFYKDGVKVGEIDVTLRGDFGSSKIFVGIECRDRPRDGAQGTPWISEVSGKKNLFKVDKMVAMSSTGFTDPAVNAANDLGIDLLTLESITNESIGMLMQLTSFAFTLKSYDLREGFYVEIDEPKLPKGITKIDATLDKPLIKLRDLDKPLTLRQFLEPEIGVLLQQFDEHTGNKEVDCEVEHPRPNFNEPIRIVARGGRQCKVKKMIVPVKLWCETARGKVLLSSYKKPEEAGFVALTGVSRVQIRGREYKALILQRMIPNSTMAKLSLQILRGEDDTPLSFPDMKVFITHLATGETKDLKTLDKPLSKINNA